MFVSVIIVNTKMIALLQYFCGECNIEVKIHLLNVCCIVERRLRYGIPNVYYIAAVVLWFVWSVAYLMIKQLMLTCK